MKTEPTNISENFENLKRLSPLQIDQNLQSLIQTERSTLSAILLHLQELDRRRNYLGYPSLFEYLVGRHKYSHGTAQRRIDAARLGREVPSLIADLEDGSLNHAQVSLVQRSLRRSQKKISVSEKRTLIETLRQKSFEESERIVAKTLELEIRKKAQIVTQADGSVRLEVTLSQEQWEKVKRMRDLLSQSLPHGSDWDQVLEYIAHRVIQIKTKTRSQKQDTQKPAPEKQSGTERSQASIKKNDPSLFVLRKQVLDRDKKCQARNPQTGEICGSSWKLQTDHIQPRWAGGRDEVQNLQALCAFHNREKYRREAGILRV